MKTSVTYDRSKKMFHVKNGTLDTFIKRKPFALLTALKHDHPELHKRVLDIYRVGNWSEPLLDRLLNAAALIAKGRVTKNGRGYEVRSQRNDEDTYVVGFSVGAGAKEWHCTCQAYTSGRVVHTTAFGGLCKHCAAAMITDFMGGTAL